MTDILQDLRPRLSAKNLKLVFAAESGSRAWGFSSPDSDFDIRFVFVKTQADYLALEAGVQDIQYTKHSRMGEPPLDFSGWDLRKALLLAAKSNPSLIEWLQSPIVYEDNLGFRAALRELMQECYSPRALSHHYMNFMRNIRGKYLSNFVGEYTLKRYFYALRPIFCVMWMQANEGLPPVEFDKVRRVEVPKEITEEVERALKLKSETREHYEFKSPVLDEFIKMWYDKGHEVADKFAVRHMDIAVLNKLFIDTLNLAQGG